MDKATRAKRYLGAALATSLAATLLSVASVAAEDVTVSGTSTSTITLTLSDATAAFGTTLTPNGGASGGEGVAVGTDATLGACYDWAANVTIDSNVAYGVDLTSTTANTHLDYMTADPANYTACTGGTNVTATLNHVDLFTGVAGSNQQHNYWLGLAVDWLDAPSGTHGAATLTFTAGA